MKFLQNLLAQKNSQIRKPYGYAASGFAEDIQHNLDTVIAEWKNYVANTASVGKPIDELSANQTHLNLDKKWKAFFIFGYGNYNPQAEIYFPETLRLVKKWEKDLTLVLFSSLEPGKHIPPHEGRNHGVVRTQFGIDIQTPDKTGLRVHDKTVQLCEKEIFTFDDTYEHEAWNSGTAVRTVLIIDSYKEFSGLYNLINRMFIKKMSKERYVTDVFGKLAKE